MLPSDPEQREKLVSRIVQLLIILLVMAATRNIWYPSGYLVFSDFDFGLQDKMYINRIFGLFNENFSSTNFFNLSRLDFIAVLYIVSLAVGTYLPHFLLRSIILACLIASALGMFHLCRWLLHRHFGDFPSMLHTFGLMVPSLFYTLNPWVIIRLQHIFLVVGYAFFPLVLKYFLELMQHEPDPPDSGVGTVVCDGTGRLAKSRLRRVRKQLLYKDVSTAVKLAFVFSIGCAAIHYFFYYSIILSGIGLALLSRDLLKKREAALDVLMRYARKAAIAGSCIFLFISYWLVPYFTSLFFLNVEPQNVNVTDTLSLFSRYSDIKHVLYMVSYWWPMFNTDKYLDLFFWTGGGIFLGIIAYTVFYRYGWHFYVRLFTWCAGISMLVSLGVNTAIIRDVNVYVVTHVPVVGHIFRDPNKLIGPMALFFSVLISFGVDKGIHFLERNGYRYWIRFGFLTVLLLCLHFYYRPFEYIFSSNYYAGRSIPEAYADVQGQYKDSGKIFWMPAMENMLVSNGIAGFNWNGTDGPTKMKSSGDFQMYSSQKPTITQHEGNAGIVSYFHSFVQSLLDSGGAQHLGSVMAWAGFNEIGFHQDVFGQDERQAYNRTILESQDDVKEHYSNGPIRLYETHAAAPDLSAVNRVLYASKGLGAIMGLLDYRNETKLQPQQTAIFWGPQRIQQSVLQENDLLLGDRLLDMVLPRLDRQYFSFPFQSVDTGNPYTGWAKTYMKTPDWSWIVKSNHLEGSDWDYDYGEGIVYTNTSHRMSAPSYKSDTVKGVPMVTIQDIWNDFFIPDNPDIFKLQYIPESANDGSVLSGTVAKGTSSAARLWQTAHSKRISFDGKVPSFLRLQATVTGINAGKMHFKVKFLNEDLEELQVAYMNKDSTDANFTKALMYTDTAVPKYAKYLEIQLLSSDDRTQNIYFYIHDFTIRDISSAVVPNTLTVTINKQAEASDSTYRTYIRLYRSETGGSLTVTDADGKSTELVTRGEENRFEWIDLGNMALKDSIKLTPNSGLNVINALVAIPVERHEAVMSDAITGLKGSQADISIAQQDYSLQTDVDLRSLSGIRTFPNSLLNSFVPMSNGKATKRIDILKDGSYLFKLNGHIPKASKVEVSLIGENGERIALTMNSGLPASMNRSMEGFYNEVKYEENRYFLRLMNISQPGWEVTQYGFLPVKLKKGTYRIEIANRSGAPNLTQISQAHVLADNEIDIPESMIDWEQHLLTYYAMNHETISIKPSHITDQSATFLNEKTASPRWFVIGLNRVPVKKGQLLVFQSKAQADSIKNLHAKLMFIGTDQKLMESIFTETTEKNGKYTMFRIAEAPADGWVQPCFFYNGLKEKNGSFFLQETTTYIMDDLVKLESTALLPADVPAPYEAPAVTGNAHGFQIHNGRYAIYNESFHPIWKMKSGVGLAEPVAVNLLHNGYPIDTVEASGSIILNPFLNAVYYSCLALSAAVHVAGAVYLIYYRHSRTRPKKKARSRLPLPASHKQKELPI